MPNYDRDQCEIVETEVNELAPVAYLKILSFHLEPKWVTQSDDNFIHGIFYKSLWVWRWMDSTLAFPYRKDYAPEMKDFEG